MTILQKIIISVNSIILTWYSVSMYSDRVHHLMILAHASFIACHLGGIIFMGILTHLLDKKAVAKAFWLSAAVVLLIGFGTCMIINN
jgi:hypothetical protein